MTIPNGYFYIYSKTNGLVDSAGYQYLVASTCNPAPSPAPTQTVNIPSTSAAIKDTGIEVCRNDFANVATWKIVGQTNGAGGSY
jgi:hypothetical protein